MEPLPLLAITTTMAAGTAVLGLMILNYLLLIVRRPTEISPTHLRITIGIHVAVMAAAGHLIGLTASQIASLLRNLL